LLQKYLYNAKIFPDTSTKSDAQILALIATIFAKGEKNLSLRFGVKIGKMYLFFNSINVGRFHIYFFFSFFVKYITKEMLCLRLTAFFALQI
jgi:hypothetical protein